MVNIGYDVNPLPNCCGVLELGGLSIEKGKNYWGGVVCETHEAAAKTILQQALITNEDYADHVVQVWFYRGRDAFEEWEREFFVPELRTLVQQLNGVIHMGTHINPNTGNEIDGYCWVNNAAAYKGIIE